MTAGKAMAIVATTIFVSCMAVLGGCDDMSQRGRVPDGATVFVQNVLEGE